MFWRTFGRAAIEELAFLANSSWDRVLVTAFPITALVIFAAMFFSAVPRGLPIAVVDDSQSPMSRQIIRTVDSAPALDVIAQPYNLHEAWPLLRSGQVHALLFLPDNLEEQLVDEQQATAFAFYNATFTTAGGGAFRDMVVAIQEVAKELALTQVAAVQGLQVLKEPPIQAQVNVLYNPGKNFEIFLLGILMPGVLVLMLTAAVASSFGREMRDKTVGAWLQRHQGQFVAALLGKVAPYVGIYWGYGILTLFWVAYVRGDGVQGSLLLLLLGMLLLYLAYAAIGLFCVAITRRMTDAFSIIGLYVGTAVAFTGSTFPIDGAPIFARIWHQLIPLSAYLKLDAAERYMDAHWSQSALFLLLLLIFTLVPGVIGGWVYRQKINRPELWGLR